MNERGYLYTETLIMITIIGIIFISGAVAGRNFLIGTLAEYEATKLISSLRYAQEQNRNSNVIREGEFKEIEPKKSTTFRLTVSENLYKLSSSLNKYPAKTYRPVKNISYGKTQSFSNGIRFYSDGSPISIGSINVKAKFGKKSATRYVIIDKAGRIRMDRKLE